MSGSPDLTWIRMLASPFDSSSRKACSVFGSSAFFSAQTGSASMLSTAGSRLASAPKVMVPEMVALSPVGAASAPFHWSHSRPMCRSRATRNPTES